MTHTFVLAEGNINIALTFEKYEQLPVKIKSSLYNDEKKYIIKSKVCVENFQNFINCFKSDTTPETNLDNMFEYYLLSKEFEIMKDHFNENDKMFYLSCLNYKFIDSIPNDKSNSEEYIAMNLDSFINEYADTLSKIPFDSLYNIFYHKKRVLHDENKAYNFIVNSSNSDKNIYFLLNSLKDSNLNQETILDSLSKSEEHLNYCPQISSVKDQVTSLKQKLSENNSTEIIDFLFPEQGSVFDVKFVLILTFSDDVFLASTF